jgi:hypothetical protein
LIHTKTNTIKDNDNDVVMFAFLFDNLFDFGIDQHQLDDAI